MHSHIHISITYYHKHSPSPNVEWMELIESQIMLLIYTPSATFVALIPVQSLLPLTDLRWPPTLF
ncbi:hypothetical protein BDV38DRAFT_250626 [Aspergillus pseudotamarii]|uniref:Uncharacterized protein n=1 Tax=Aspergillus pseudotamarii TaxID=132259 RepID=A0A5N6SQL1_ASPPS|nr:uncharacterized protein BDV38DRAFT_250626 [Aspergillus pseudotamarii]KAE8136119.1 hypothetical protein BDV38DRAFT_250626 [Aspergillus pseudotamarii]